MFSLFSSFSFLILMLYHIPCFPARTLTEFHSNIIHPTTVLPVNNGNSNPWDQSEGGMIIDVEDGEDATGTSKVNMHPTRHFGYFTNQTRWVTYAFSTEQFIQSLSSNDIRAVIQRAFVRWASVIPVSFSETETYGQADIKIGFYQGDHGDGQPFDGALGVLAHAFSPESGELHFDATETWAVNFGSEKSMMAVDLESVAVHEIGHVLGLAHSSVKEAVMYPSLSPRTKKVELKLDDVQGIQALYGSNPNFSFSSLLESYTSSNQVVGRLKPFFKNYKWPWLSSILVIVCTLCS